MYKKLNVPVKQSFNVIFILFKIISDLKKTNEEMGDKLTLAISQEAPDNQPARADQEINPETLPDLDDLEDLEDSREGKLNPAMVYGNMKFSNLFCEMMLLRSLRQLRLLRSLRPQIFQGLINHN